MTETTITGVPLSEDTREKLSSATKEDVLAAIQSVFSARDFDKHVEAILNAETDKYFENNSQFEVVNWESQMLDALESVGGSRGFEVMTARPTAAMFLAGMVVGMVVMAVILR